MLRRIPRHVRKDSGECSKLFRGMFKEIPGNAQEDFRESKFIFYQILQLKCDKTKEYFLRY